MKKFLLTLVAATLCLGISAQKQYVMKITKADGSTVEINADDVKDVTFVQEGTDPIVLGPHHFDLTVTVGKQGGMGRDVTTIMQSREKLDAGAVVDFKNVGAEINADYTMESIVRGKYYYQVPVAGDRFVKLQFKDNKMEVVQAQPFKENTYNIRQYCHAWTADNQLVIMAANGDKNAIVWTKINTDDMTIVSEGTLSLSLGEGWDSFTTSGIAAYRESDGKLFYFYYNKKGSGRTATKEDAFHVAVINAETMEVEHDNLCPFAAEIAGSAYGELLQQTTFFDEAGNLYLAAFSDTSIGEEGKLLRIKKGEFNFEEGYNAFPASEAKGKLLTVQYLGNGKVLAYSGDNAAGTGIQDPAYYYSIIDINAKTATRLQYNGEDIAYSAGSFSQRSVYNAKENKAYFGVSNETENRIYIYDVATGNVSLGSKLATGVYFDQIRFFEK